MLKEDLETMDVDWSDARDTASDHARWRQLVVPLGTGGTNSKSKQGSLYNHHSVPAFLTAWWQHAVPSQEHCCPSVL